MGSHLKSAILTVLLAGMLSMQPALWMGATLSAAEKIQVGALAARPTLDGNAQDWAKVPGVQIPLRGDLGIGSVEIKCGTFGQEMFLLAVWKDSTEDIQHKPFVWNAGKGKYDTRDDMEDRVALQFAMEGDYTADWVAGNAFKADMWHWKAARSNPIGLAHDKMTVISTREMKKAYKTKAKNGKTIYILRPSDSGDSLYTTKRYRKREQDVMPKYILAKQPKGSIADVQARGRWQAGVWTVEFSRKLNTGHKDDAVFKKGQAIKGGIAVFNRSGDDKHDISDTLVFQF